MSTDAVRKCWNCDKLAMREWSYPGDEWKPWCGERQCGPICHVYGLGVRDIVAASQPHRSRIAALEAELADKESDRARIERLYREEQRRHAASDAAHERTKAELAAERADRLNIDEHRGRLMRERDAALAEAAAMREALETLRSWTMENDNNARRLINGVLSSTAGRALAARVPLWRELERLLWTHGSFDHEVDDVLERLRAIDAQETK
jgi:hypothetical protein